MKSVTWVKLLALAATGLLVLLLSKDPYSYGNVGGEFFTFEVVGDKMIFIAPYPWQRWYTAGLLLLMALALFQLIRGRVKEALVVFAAESVLFVGVNVVYLLRDGAAVRTLVGDEGSTTPGDVAIGGLLIRAALVSLLLGYWHRIHRNPAGEL